MPKGQPFPNDPYFAFNSLLLHGNGTNGSTVITDSSGSPKTVTAVGNAQISTAQSKFGGASIAFDGSGDYLTVPQQTSLYFGSDNFTVELWAYRVGIGGEILFWNANSSAYGTRIVHDSSNCQFLASTSGSSHAIAVNKSAEPANQWIHFALCRDGNTFNLFINGVARLTGTAFGALINGDANVIGGRSYIPSSFEGYIDDVRITKGVARYTANFTPPTLAFPDF
jgi:hypothetical protein